VGGGGGDDCGYGRVLVVRWGSVLVTENTAED